MRRCCTGMRRWLGASTAHHMQFEYLTTVHLPTPPLTTYYLLLYYLLPTTCACIKSSSLTQSAMIQKAMGSRGGGQHGSSLSIVCIPPSDRTLRRVRWGWR